MRVFCFHEFLEKVGFEPEKMRLLRHDSRGLAAWRTGGSTTLGCFASFQRKNPAPYAGVQIACHFLPGPVLRDGDVTALFVGTTRILDQWSWDGLRLPRLQDPAVIEGERNKADLDAFDLEWVDAGRDFSERLLIRWGAPASARAWSQWADRNPKEIVEIRLDPREPPFPGFSAFISRIRELNILPVSWQSALGSVRGIYLLVSDDGEQYVGSASGSDGFMGRWRNYMANGHGSNLLLQRRGHHDYTVSILQIASPDMSHEDILAREAFWKDKLGARAHGLNAN